MKFVNFVLWCNDKMILSEGPVYNRNRYSGANRHQNNIDSEHKVSKEDLLGDCDRHSAINTDVVRNEECAVSSDVEMSGLPENSTCTAPHEESANTTTVPADRNEAAETQQIKFNVRPILSYYFKKEKKIAAKRTGESCFSFVIDIQSKKRKLNGALPSMSVHRKDPGPKQKKAFMSYLGLQKKVARVSVGSSSSSKTSEDVQNCLDSPLLKPDDKSPILKLGRNSQYYGTGKLPCHDLGEGWSFEQIVRRQGKTAGTFDVYYHSPDKVRLRSKLKLQEHLGPTVSLTDFDYNCGRFYKPDEKPIHKKDALLLDKLKWCNDGKVGGITQNKVLSIKDAGFKTRTDHASSRYPLRKRKRLGKLKLKWCKRRKLYDSHRQKDDSRASLDSKAKDVFHHFPRSEGDLGYKVFKHHAEKTCSDIASESLPIDLILTKAWDLLEDDKKACYFAMPVADSRVSSHRKLKPSPSSRRTSTKIRPRHRRCGWCDACHAKNCGKCSSCKDMKQFGGGGKKKQSCLARRCKNMFLPGKKFVSKSKPSAVPLAEKQKPPSSNADQPDSLVSLLEKNGMPTSDTLLTHTSHFIPQIVVNPQSTIAPACLTNPLSVTPTQSNQLFTTAVCTKTTLSSTRTPHTLTVSHRSFLPHSTLHSIPQPQGAFQSDSVTFMSQGSMNRSNSNSLSSSGRYSSQETRSGSAFVETSQSELTSSLKASSSKVFLRNYSAGSSKSVGELEESEAEESEAEESTAEYPSENLPTLFEEDEASNVTTSSQSSDNIDASPSNTLYPPQARTLEVKSKQELIEGSSGHDRCKKVCTPTTVTDKNDSEAEYTLNKIGSEIASSSLKSALESSSASSSNATIESLLNERQLSLLNSLSAATQAALSKDDEAGNITTQVDCETPSSIEEVGVMSTSRTSTPHTTANATVECSSNDLRHSVSSLECSVLKHSSLSNSCTQDLMALYHSVEKLFSCTNRFVPVSALPFQSLSKGDENDSITHLTKARENATNSSADIVTPETTKLRQSVTVTTSQVPKRAKKSPMPFVNPLKVLSTAPRTTSFVNPNVLKRKQGFLPLEIGNIEPSYEKNFTSGFDGFSALKRPTILPTTISKPIELGQYKQKDALPLSESNSKQTPSSERNMSSPSSPNPSQATIKEIFIKEETVETSGFPLSNVSITTHSETASTPPVSVSTASTPPVSGSTTSRVIRKSTNSKKFKKAISCPKPRTSQGGTFSLPLV